MSGLLHLLLLIVKKKKESLCSYIQYIQSISENGNVYFKEYTHTTRKYILYYISASVFMALKLIKIFFKNKIIYGTCRYDGLKPNDPVFEKYTIFQVAYN